MNYTEAAELANEIKPKIVVPTHYGDIVGEKDDVTPVWMSREMESRMQDAALIVFEGCHHFAYLQDRYRFMKIVKVFLEKEEEHA